MWQLVAMAASSVGTFQMSEDGSKSVGASVVRGVTVADGHVTEVYCSKFPVAAANVNWKLEFVKEKDIAVWCSQS